MGQRRQFTLEERRFLFNGYKDIDKDYTFEDMIGKFHEAFPASRIPARETVRKIFIEFNTAYTLHNLNKGKSGRKIRVCTREDP